MPEGLICQLDKENREGDIRRHMRDIHRHRIEQAHLWIPLDNRHNTRRLWKCLLHPTGEEWKLNDHAWWLGGKHLHRRCQLMGLDHLPQSQGLKALVATQPSSVRA